MSYVAHEKCGKHDPWFIDNQCIDQCIASCDEGFEKDYENGICRCADHLSLLQTF